MQKQTPERKRRRKAVPVLGAAGLSLSLASGASGGPAANLPTPTVEGATKSFSLKRKSPTSAWLHSMSSTRRTPVHSDPVFSLSGVVAEAVAAVEAAAWAAEAEAEAVGVAAFRAAPAVSASAAVSASGVPGALLSPAQAVEDIGAAAVCRGAPVVLLGAYPRRRRRWACVLYVRPRPSVLRAPV